MDAIFSFNTLLIVNLSLLGALFLYLLSKIKAHPSVGYLVASLTPLIGFQLGCYLFTNRPTSPEGATLIVLGVALIPVAVTPVSHTLGRARATLDRLAGLHTMACRSSCSFSWSAEFSPVESLNG